MRTGHFSLIRLGAFGLLGAFFLAGPLSAAVVNDYDGDGKSDVAIYDASSGDWNIALSSRSFGFVMQTNLGGKTIGRRPAPGDYDGDRKTDIAVMSKTGEWQMFLSGSSNALVSINFGVAGAGPIPGDYDGDGITDLAYYEKASGEWGIHFSESGLSASAQWGGPGFIPAPADFDGDGKTDPCLYQESTGLWQILFSGAGYATYAAGVWGGPGFQAMPDDFDNDGCADPCVYNRITGEWRLLLSGSDYQPVSLVWGGAAFQPVPGDYDGDGYADPMVYSDAIPDWSVLLSESGYAAAHLPYGGTNWAAVKPLWRNDLGIFMAFGDSITSGGGSSSDSPATGYPKLLEAKLRQHFDGFFSSVNKGIGGEDTYDGFERFGRTLDIVNPDLVLLMEGTNDSFYGTPYSEIEENLRNMVRIALGRGIPVIIATIPPVISNAYRNRRAQMERIVGFNPRIYRIAADFNIQVAPVFEAITSVPGWESRLMDQPSANHPNDAGHQVICDTFGTAIAAGLNAGRY